MLSLSPSRMIGPLVVCSCLIVAADACAATTQSDCDHTAPRSAVVNAQGATRVRVDARAGSLRIEGKPGIREVRITGVACTDRRGLLDDIRLIADRQGGEVRVVAELPERVMNGNARLDLVIEVPESLPLDVKDSSGGIEIRRVASLRLEDGSGEIEIEEVAGDLRIDDNSGEIRVLRVRGDVRVSDGSGAIRIDEVGGSVLIDEDGSGEIVIQDVAGSVRVERDGSGGIRVERVRGDFTVDRDGSGGISHREVGGAVRIP
jgi:hypothetical protein